MSQIPKVLDSHRQFPCKERLPLAFENSSPPVHCRFLLFQAGIKINMNKINGLILQEKGEGLQCSAREKRFCLC